MGQPAAPDHKRIISSREGRLAATCPANWFSENGDEYVAFGTGLGALHEGIGNLKSGDVAVHLEVIGRLGETLRADQAMFAQIIQERDTTVYADAKWSMPVHRGKNAASITGRSDYGDQTLILIAQPGEWEKIEPQINDIVESIRYLG
jgi:hypothetical protein